MKLTQFSRAGKVNKVLLPFSGNLRPPVNLYRRRKKTDFPPRFFCDFFAKTRVPMPALFHFLHIIPSRLSLQRASGNDPSNLLYDFFPSSPCPPYFFIRL